MDNKERLKLRKRQLELELELAKAKENEANVAPPTTTDKEPQKPEISELESAGRGVQQGATLGYADEIGGAITAGLTAANRGLNKIGLGVEDPYQGKELSEVYSADRDKDRQMYNDAAVANPKSYAAGDMAGGTLTSLAVPGMGASKLGALGKAAVGTGRETALGALEGAGRAEEDVAGNALSGGALGGVLGGSGEMVGLIRKYGPEKARMLANYLAEKAAGLRRTQGQREAIAERIGSGKWADGEAGQLLRDQNLISVRPSRTASNIEAAKEIQGQRIREALSKADNVSPEQLKGKFSAAAEPLADNISPQAGAQVSYLDNFSKRIDDLTTPPPPMASKVLDYNGNPIMSQAPAKKADFTVDELMNDKSLVGRTVNDFLSDAVSKDSGKKAYGVLRDSIDEAVERGGGKEALGELKDANKKYSLLSTAEEAADKNAANMEGKQFFRLGQAVPTAIAASAGGPAAAIAAAGVNQLMTKSGAAIGSKLAGGVEKILSKAPPEKMNILQKALERGDKSFMATHYLLMQNDPNYRQSISQDEED